MHWIRRTAQTVETKIKV